MQHWRPRCDSRQPQQEPMATTCRIAMYNFSGGLLKRATHVQDALCTSGSVTRTSRLSRAAVTADTDPAASTAVADGANRRRRRATAHISKQESNSESNKSKLTALVPVSSMDISIRSRSRRAHVNSSCNNGMGGAEVYPQASWLQLKPEHRSKSFCDVSTHHCCQAYAYAVRLAVTFWTLCHVTA